VYHGSSKKVLTALLTLADCVGSLNNFLSILRSLFFVAKVFLFLHGAAGIFVEKAPPDLHHRLGACFQLI